MSYLVCHNKHIDPSGRPMTPVDQLVPVLAFQRRWKVSGFELQGQQEVNHRSDLLLKDAIEFFVLDLLKIKVMPVNNNIFPYTQDIDT